MQVCSPPRWKYTEVSNSLPCVHTLPSQKDMNVNSLHKPRQEQGEFRSLMSRYVVTELLHLFLEPLTDCNPHCCIMASWVSCLRCWYQPAYRPQRQMDDLRSQETNRPIRTLQLQCRSPTQSQITRNYPQDSKSIQESLPKDDGGSSCEVSQHRARLDSVTWHLPTAEPRLLSESHLLVCRDSKAKPIFELKKERAGGHEPQREVKSEVVNQGWFPEM